MIGRMATNGVYPIVILVPSPRGMNFITGHLPNIQQMHTKSSFSPNGG